MPRGLKDKPCIFCPTGLSTRTGDHIFARTLFLVKRRDNLPRVPACAQCNNKKVVLEHYLATVLPFGGRHADATANLEEQVPGRLRENLRVHRELSEGRETIEVAGPDGVQVGTTALPFEASKLLKYMEYVVRGLMWYHWQVRLDTGYGVRAMTPTNAAAGFILKTFEANKTREVFGDLGAGTIEYRGFQFIGQPPETSFWSISLYGGLVFSDHSNNPDEQSSAIHALTATDAFLQRPAVINVFGDGATDESSFESDDDLDGQEAAE